MNGIWSFAYNNSKSPEGVECLDEIHVIGGKCLHGNITVQGSKNTVLPLMAGALLYRGINVLKACPRITDVFYMEEILRALGAETWWEDHDLYLDCTHADGSHVPEIYSGRMRSSIILLGPILARNHQAEDRLSGRLCDREATGGSSSLCIKAFWGGNKRRREKK